MIKRKKSGQLIVISGPSGAGKGTIIKEFLKDKKKDEYWLSISATSRKPRPGDEEGVTYFFLEKDDFEKKIKEDYFLEYAEYAGNYYGTPKEKIKEKLDNGIDVILEIEIQGAAKVKDILPEAIFIFITPPTEKTLLKRLSARNTESKEKVLERFRRAYKEINEVTRYNYVVVNDELADAVDKVDSIIKAEKCRVDRIEEVLLDNEEETIHEFLIDDQEFDNSPTSERIEKNS